MKRSPSKDIACNKKAFFEYTLLEKLECGIELKGPEVKSCRKADISLSGSFVKIENAQAYLYGMHISPYMQSGPYAPDPKRTRRLLLHKSQLSRLYGFASQRGYTLVPVRVYLKKGFVKIEIAVAKGKKLFDKREKLRQKTIEREIRRSIK
ncbi:MAG: SsrA-binding protein SmpB [Candidatus Omnitrophica bacterium]|nr:SsrA-binding protein SmpB [Candidatus Omnitrophota bacterium]